MAEETESVDPQANAEDRFLSVLMDEPIEKAPAEEAAEDVAEETEEETQEDAAEEAAEEKEETEDKPEYVEMEIDGTVYEVPKAVEKVFAQEKY